MSLDSVRAFFATHAPDIAVLVTEQSSATVAEAALAHGVDAGQIAKTLCVSAGDEIVLVVMGGMARLDNKKFRALFGAKPRMVEQEEVARLTSHPVGGVCPFGLATQLRIFCDQSLKAYDVVVPAAGAINAAVHIPTDRLIELTSAQWVDVAQEPASG